jgi:hypothetical protein
VDIPCLLNDYSKIAKMDTVAYLSIDYAKLLKYIQLFYLMITLK